MRVMIQRVTESSVTIDGVCKGKIGKGFLVLLGVGAEDTKELTEKMVQKLLKLRIFEDEEGKTNRSLSDVSGELLVISQFTLYADCRKGNRPSFVKAGSPQLGNELYEYFIELCKREVPVVESGEFGADMKVQLLNDGPFTIYLDSDEIIK